MLRPLFLGLVIAGLLAICPPAQAQTKKAPVCPVGGNCAPCLCPSCGCAMKANLTLTAAPMPQTSVPPIVLRAPAYAPAAPQTSAKASASVQAPKAKVVVQTAPPAAYVAPKGYYGGGYSRTRSTATTETVSGSERRGLFRGERRLFGRVRGGGC